eukprot:evm.model.scf_1327.3 EVM.evm.TU.scf_1327.3   scf_1327:40371-42806(+)
MPILLQTFANWKWPSPVVLEPVPMPSYPLNAWDVSHSPIMPILTPGEPCLNTAHHVDKETLAVMVSEFKRAARAIKEGMLPGIQLLEEADDVDSVRPEWDWDGAVERCPFFEGHSSFLRVTVEANNEHDFKMWSGYCHSRLRHLVKTVNRYMEARIWPCSTSAECPRSFQTRYYIGVTCKEPRTDRQVRAHKTESGATCVDLRGPISAFMENTKWGFWQWAPGMEIFVSHWKRHDLPAALFQDGKAPDKKVNMYGGRSPNSSAEKATPGGRSTGEGSNPDSGDVNTPSSHLNNAESGADRQPDAEVLVPTLECGTPGNGGRSEANKAGGDAGRKGSGAADQAASAAMGPGKKGAVEGGGAQRAAREATSHFGMAEAEDAVGEEVDAFTRCLPPGAAPSGSGMVCDRRPGAQATMQPAGASSSPVGSGAVSVPGALRTCAKPAGWANHSRVGRGVSECPGLENAHPSVPLQEGNDNTPDGALRTCLEPGPFTLSKSIMSENGSKRPPGAISTATKKGKVGGKRKRNPAEGG